MNVKKFAILVGVALLAFFVVSQPEQSAGVVGSIIDGLKSAAQAVVTFVASLFL